LPLPWLGGRCVAPKQHPARPREDSWRRRRTPTTWQIPPTDLEKSRFSGVEHFSAGAEMGHRADFGFFLAGRLGIHQQPIGFDQDLPMGFSAVIDASSKVI